jgi:hypothetical protein
VGLAERVALVADEGGLQLVAQTVRGLLDDRFLLEVDRVERRDLHRHDLLVEDGAGVGLLRLRVQAAHARHADDGDDDQERYGQGEAGEQLALDAQVLDVVHLGFLRERVGGGVPAGASPCPRGDRR